MKYKLIGLFAVLGLLVLSFVFYDVDNGKGMARVHQHKTDVIPEETSSDVFSTHLPIVSIHTNDQAIPGVPLMPVEEGFTLTPDGKEEIIANMKIIDNKKAYNKISDEAEITTNAEISYRGNSSRFFDKKSLAVRFVNEDGSDREERVMGMGSDDEWVLNGPFLDRTLIRNYLSLNIAGEIMEYAPNVRYCEVFINDEYQGVYLLMEVISQSKNRVNIDKTEDNKSETSYIIRWDRNYKGDHILDNYTNYTLQTGISALDIKYPGIKNLTDAKMNYIEEDISEMEKALYSYDLNTKGKGYEEYIDRNSFAEYFIINELFKNMDAGRFSTFFYKDVRGKLMPVVWDFNNAFDNYVDDPQNETGFRLVDAPWFNMLLKDEAFVSTIVLKYQELRKSTLKTEYLIEYIEETKEFLGPAIERNYEKYGYVFDLENAKEHNYLNPLERNSTSYDESVEQLKEYIENRGQWLDEHIESLYQYCQDSKTKNTLLK